MSTSSGLKCCSQSEHLGNRGSISRWGLFLCFVSPSVCQINNFKINKIWSSYEKCSLFLWSYIIMHFIFVLYTNILKICKRASKIHGTFTLPFNAIFLSPFHEFLKLPHCYMKCKYIHMHVTEIILTTPNFYIHSFINLNIVEIMVYQILLFTWIINFYLGTVLCHSK